MLILSLNHSLDWGGNIQLVKNIGKRGCRNKILPKAVAVLLNVSHVISHVSCSFRVKGT